MILFVMDACAVARRYFTDIGTRNTDQLFNYPDSILVLPNIARSETVSAMIAAYNAMLIDEAMRDSAIVQFADDVQNGVLFLEVKVNDTHISESIRLLEKHKIVPHGTYGTGKADIGGADSIILSIAVELAQSAQQSNDRTILVTSDRALYRAANDERRKPAKRQFEAERSEQIWRCSISGHANAQIADIFVFRKKDGGKFVPIAVRNV